MPDEIRQLAQKLWTIALNKAEETTIDGRISLLELEKEKLRKEIMGYEEMKIQVEAIKQNNDKLLDRLEQKSKEDERRDREKTDLEKQVEELKIKLEKLLTVKEQDDFSIRDFDYDVNPSD